MCADCVENFKFEHFFCVTAMDIYVRCEKERRFSHVARAKFKSHRKINLFDVEAVQLVKKIESSLGASRIQVVASQYFSILCIV